MKLTSCGLLILGAAVTAPVASETFARSEQLRQDNLLLAGEYVAHRILQH